LRIQVLNLYQDMASKGNFDQLYCPNHEDNIYTLYPFMIDEKIGLECYACKGIIYPGFETYQMILKKLKSLGINEINLNDE
jgi:hypothetical protein